jgi:histidinol-phosphate/aromatic aminotransferase/cobyric acid decarboxylase-like protein
VIAARRGGGVGLGPHGGRNAVGRPVRHDFSVCTNAFGPADVVRDAIRNASFDEYPDATSRLACAAGADAWSVPIQSLLLAAGSAELIDLVCRAFVAPGDLVAIDAPAFGEYERAARIYGARIIRELDDSARVVFVCAPSNPLGEIRGQDELKDIADRCAERGGLLVLDQAYDAFTDSPVGAPAIRGHPAALHLRSLTKEHAIPGVRVAFALAPTEIIEALNTVRMPWSASSIAQTAAIAAFTPEANAHVQKTTVALRREAYRLRALLATIGYQTNESRTHFFTIHVRDATAATGRLLDRFQLLVRDCTSFGLPDRIRVAAHTPAENDELLRAMSELSSELLPP